MKSQLTIPTKIHVGQVERSDTYTGKLGYVIYTDNKGVVRKEKSWEGWRDKNILPLDLDNVPTDGFVLNKGVGGARESYGWNTRNEYIRVYDPRDFEFEISVKNLLYILQECTSTKGKGLEGQFVYAWDGKDLVLLPTTTPEFVASTEFTDLKSLKVSTKELTLGGQYYTKSQEVWTYLGKLDYFEFTHPDLPKNDQNYYYKNSDYSKQVLHQKKFHIFIDDAGKYQLETGASKLAKILDSSVSGEHYADLIDTYYKTKHGSKPVELIYKEIPGKLTVDESYYKRNIFEGGKFESKDGLFIYHDISSVEKSQWIDEKYSLVLLGWKDEPKNQVSIKNGELIHTRIEAKVDKYATYRNIQIKTTWGTYQDTYQPITPKYETNEEILNLKLGELYVKLESGTELKYTDYKSGYY